MLKRIATEEEERDLAAEERLIELRHVLKTIATSLNKPSDDSVAKSINKLIIKLADLKPADVNVKVDTKDFVQSIDKLAYSLLAELKKFNDRPIVEGFKMGTNQFGAKTVTVIYKENGTGKRK